MIGHAGHPEVEGTLGQSNASSRITLVESIKDIKDLELSKDLDISYTTQTTLSVDDTQEIVDSLKAKFPKIQAPKKSDICYATQNRQDSVKSMIKNSEMLLVIGSKNSSNSASNSSISSSCAISSNNTSISGIASSSVVAIRV